MIYTVGSWPSSADACFYLLSDYTTSQYCVGSTRLIGK